ACMSRRSLQILFLTWLCWYLAGPLFETFDSWDTPQEELADIASSESGSLVWAAAGICIAVLLFQHLCKYSHALSGSSANVSLPESFNSRGYTPRPETPRILDTSPLRL